MFGSGYGSGIGSSGGGSGQPSGDQLLVSVVAEVVPVRLVMNQPIKVQVVNFPGVPPPLPGLSAEPYVPGLPRRMKPAGNAKPGLDLTSALPLVPGGGMMAGILGAAGPVGAVVAAVTPLIAAIDSLVMPLVSAVKNGFQSGMQSGMGTGVLSKSFEVLGTVVGVQLLPVVIRLAALGLQLADTFKSIDDAAHKWGATIDNFTARFGLNTGFNQMGINGPFGSNRMPGPMGALQGLAGGLGRFGIFGMAARATGINTQQMANVAQQKDEGAMGLVRESMLRSIGGSASYYGIADIREQLQLTALNQDPLEAKRKQLEIDALMNALPALVKASEETAKNTAPIP